MDRSNSFGYWIRRKRKALDLTQEDLARCVGCAEITLRKLEADDRRPSRQMAERIASCLQLSQPEKALFLEVAKGDRSPAQLKLPTAPAHPRPKGNLPAPMTPIIGRTGELAGIQNCLRRKEIRLHTLTGPQGVGKTRLAIEAGLNLRGNFRDGIYLIDLIEVQDPAAIARVTAGALGFREPYCLVSDGTIVETLLGHEVLLIYDHFDHLKPAVDFLIKLLKHAPDVHLLVTCCTPLNIYGEYEYVVPPLIMPAGENIPADTESASVQLFCERMRAFRNDYRLTDDQSSIVFEICRRLGGIPAAIENIVAQSRHISLNDLLFELDQ